MQKVRYETIDIARGLAILLVVVGHFSTPEMPLYLKTTIRLIYTFHMPLFIFVSGFLAVATRRGDVAPWLWKKFKRLMIPYFSTSIVILLIKLATQTHLQVDHPVTPSDFLEILYLPSAGYFLWFLWALWWMMCLIPLVNTPKRRLALLAASFLIFPLQGYITDLFCLRQTAFYLMYFAAGAVSFDLIKKYKRLRFSGTSLFASIGSYTLLAILFLSLKTKFDSTYYIVTIAAAFAGIAMSLCLSNAILKTRSRLLLRPIMSISSAAYIIYLFHTTFEGFAKSFLSKIHFLQVGDSAPNWMNGMDIDIRYAIAMVFVAGIGTLFPMLLNKYFLSRFRVTRFLFGG